MDSGKSKAVKFFIVLYHNPESLCQWKIPLANNVKTEFNWKKPGCYTGPNCYFKNRFPVSVRCAVFSVRFLQKTRVCLAGMDGNPDYNPPERLKWKVRRVRGVPVTKIRM
jgi:hypothetical protein